MILFQFPIVPFKIPETKIVNTIEIKGREPFYGDDIKYLQPKLNDLGFLCIPIEPGSPGVYEVDLCVPQFKEEDILEA